MNKVYLVGMPGSGKSTIAAQLANHLGWQHLDLDLLLQNKFNQTIPQIFETIGEEQFRIAEQIELQATSKLSETVISTGGGTPIHFDNMEWINNNGLSIYINTTLPEICARIAQNCSERPMFKGLEPTQIEEKVSKMFQNRELFYSKSKIVWNKGKYTEDLQVTVNQLIKLYSDMRF